MRVILYTGKGGVGKTSVSAATALGAADCGNKTLVLSTDPAHSLGDCLDIPLSGEPQALGENLWAQEVDVYQEVAIYWGAHQTWLKLLMAWHGMDVPLAEEMAVLPGMEELSGLLYLNQLCQSADYDVAIVDCAPTGETLRLLSLPDAMRWWMHRIFPAER